jgi:hypothetical protein
MKETTTTKPSPVYWMGPVPQACDMCGRPIGDTFIDGATRPQGRWGNLDLRCHRMHGVGIGTGKGQLYTKQDDGRFLKTEG